MEGEWRGQYVGIGSQEKGEHLQYDPWNNQIGETSKMNNNVMLRLQIKFLNCNLWPWYQSLGLEYSRVWACFRVKCLKLGNLESGFQGMRHGKRRIILCIGQY